MHDESSFSVHFHNAVDFSREPEASEKPNGACDQKEAENHDTRVAKVKKGWSCSFNLQLSNKIVDTVDSKVESCESTC